jgi:hypothetical protein
MIKAHSILRRMRNRANCHPILTIRAVVLYRGPAQVSVT